MADLFGGDHSTLLVPALMFSCQGGAGLGLSTSSPGAGFAPGELPSGIVSQGLAGAALSTQGSVTLAWDPPQTIKTAQGEVNNLVYEAVKPSLLFF